MTLSHVDLGGDQLSFEDDGDPSHPVVVLCHGAGYDGTTFADLAGRLVLAGHRVLRPDTRGAGRSTDRDGLVALEGPVCLGRDLVAVLDAAGVGTAHVVGHSLGGWTALGAALLAPSLVASLLLVGTPAGVFTPEVDRFWDGFEARLTDGAPPEAAAAFRLIRATAPDLDAVTALADLLPVAFVVGEDDAVYPTEVVRAAAAALPGAAVTVVAGAGHHVHLDRQDALLAIIIETVARARPARRGPAPTPRL